MSGMALQLERGDSDVCPSESFWTSLIKSSGVLSVLTEGRGAGGGGGSERAALRDEEENWKGAILGSGRWKTSGVGSLNECWLDRKSVV